MFKDQDGITAVDAAQLLDPEQRKIADGLRIVEPAVKLKKTVSKTIAPSLHSLYEENIPLSNP